MERATQLAGIGFAPLQEGGHGRARGAALARGKVLFLAPNGDRLRWVNEDGSLGGTVKLPGMQERERLAQTAPAA